MQLYTPLVPAPDAPLPRINPLAKLAAALLLMGVLFTSVDWLTAVLVLGALTATLPLSGLSLRAVLGRAWPVLVTAMAVGILNVLLAPQQSGAPLRLGPITIGLATLVDGLGLAARLVGIALAGLLATLTTRPTDLADALVQQLRVPARFAVGALAAVRLLPLLAQELQTMALARRARGVEAGRSPLLALRLFAGLLFALLIAAVRRGTRLARAMEARGFGARGCRSVARPQHTRAADWGWIAGAALAGAAAVAISLAVGTWRFLFG